MMPLILASASASRARLLADVGVAFDVRPARGDEDSLKASLLAEGADGRMIADALAELKAVRVSASYPGRLVLGADQVLGVSMPARYSSEGSLSDAEVLVQAPHATVLATLVTNPMGVAGFATPVDVPPHDIVLRIEHPEFNPRHVRLDGTNLVVDLRRELYGAR